MQVAGIVLCGGTSRRMGTPKAHLPFGGELMLPRVVRLLSAAVAPVVVVAAADQILPELPPRIQIERDRFPDRGPLEGLRTGLTSLPSDGAAYLSGCDTPFLLPEFVRAMTGMLGDHEIAVPHDGEFHHPLAAVYRRNILPVVERLLDEGRRRPLDLFAACDTRYVPVDLLRTVDPELSSLRNLNRPDDYADALRDADS